jgi:hypothetical protein
MSSITLKDFLREQAAAEVVRSKTAEIDVEQWRASIDRLYQKIRTWLADSDPNGLIKIEQREHEVSEPRIGVYHVPRLDLRAFGSSVGIIPNVIHTVGTVLPPNGTISKRASGRVDITDDVHRSIVYLYRDEEGRESWWMLDKPFAGTSQDKEFTKQDFETILLRYFR